MSVDHIYQVWLLQEQNFSIQRINAVFCTKKHLRSRMFLIFCLKKIHWFFHKVITKSFKPRLKCIADIDHIVLGIDWSAFSRSDWGPFCVSWNFSWFLNWQSIWKGYAELQRYELGICCLYLSLFETRFID